VKRKSGLVHADAAVVGVVEVSGSKADIAHH